MLPFGSKKGGGPDGLVVSMVSIGQGAQVQERQQSTIDTLMLAKPAVPDAGVARSGFACITSGATGFAKPPPQHVGPNAVSNFGRILQDTQVQT